MNEGLVQLAARPESHVLIRPPRPHRVVGIGATQRLDQRPPSLAQPLRVKDVCTVKPAQEIG
jgi:hypothetical protein